MAMKILSLVLVLLFTGCVTLPDGVTPVVGFRVEKFLGKWYEVARLDHPFERGLTRVSAEYSVREDGGLRVVNRGYSARENRWKQAVGKAYFVQDPRQGFLRVSFFGPFYGAYVVVDLDHEYYRYALVCGPDRSYLWILSRSPEMQADVRDRLVAKAAALGFDTSALAPVAHD